MDIRKQFITELKRNRVNFDSDNANYIDDNFDYILECVVNVVNKNCNIGDFVGRSEQFNCPFCTRGSASGG